MSIFQKGKKLEQFQDDLMQPTANETAAQVAAAQTRAQYQQFQNMYQPSIKVDAGGYVTGFGMQAKPTAERVIISTEEFMAMPIQSMEELMTVLTMRLRLTGTVLEEDGKLTVTIDQKKKEVTIEARNPIKAKS